MHIECSNLLEHDSPTVNTVQCSACVSAQAGRVSTPEVPKKDANSKLDDKHALTKLASREKLSKSSQSLNDLLTQDKFKMEVMRLLEQDRKSLPRDDSTVYENTSEKCDETRQDRSSDTVSKDAEVRRAAMESKDKSDNSADRYGGDESRYVLNATSAYFPTDSSSRRFASPQPFFQPRPDALGYGYYRSDAYAYPPPEYYGMPHLRAGPRGFHYMARPRMPHYPPSYRPNQNPVRAPTNFVPPYQQSQKKSPRNPAWIPDFLPELK
ncbi:unnamed protein product [Dicrocoelium dendriticum]|nr:unnamed protein product [Dicrocoelium dendriticum]